jgi:ribosomal protein RSM22 (predicted rRNA methylase)
VSGPALPAGLRDGIAAFIHDIPSDALARRARAMSAAYRDGAASARAIRDASDIGAYLAARLPATYAAISAALEATDERMPGFKPASLLDAGAGPGTASWAAAGRWPALERIAMLDSSPQFLSAAEVLARSSANAALRSAAITRGDLAAIEEASAFDVVIAGYALGELPASARARTIQRLWQACRGVLLIVEPGTPSGFERILAARQLLLEQGARIAAPCPGAYACPMAAPKWCHFAVRLPRSRAHLRAKDAEVPFEDEKFSYLAVAREGLALEPVTGRIVAPPRRLKPEVRLTVCAGGAISERVIPSRDKPAFKAAAKKNWGDAI